MEITRLGTVHVQLHDDHVRVSNPGGFVIGVRPDNLLVADPHPRNPLLADAFKRVGLVERTGRGVSIIYTGQAQNGRRPPDYRYSTEVSVLVTLDSGPADLDFVRLSIQANRRLGRALRVEELLALWTIWQEGATTPSDLAPCVQQSADDTAALLAGLAHLGVFQMAEGAYTLSEELSRAKEREPPQASPAVAILAYVKTHGRITRREAVAVTGLTDEQARYQLRKLAKRGDLEQIGAGRGAYYRAPQTGKNGE